MAHRVHVLDLVMLSDQVFVYSAKSDRGLGIRGVLQVGVDTDDLFVDDVCRD